MSPEEMRGHPATVGKPASRVTKKPLADAETVGAVEMAGAVGIESAEKRADEEFPMAPNEMTEECLGIDLHRTVNATGIRLMINFFDKSGVGNPLVLSVLLFSYLL